MKIEMPPPRETVDEMRKQVLRSIGRTEAEVKRDAALGLKVDFFLSSITPFSKFMTLEEIVAWLTRFRETSQNSVERIGIRDLEKWRVEEGTGNIRHESGKFFSIEGVRIQMKNREVASWCQPIINQPEVGILGIIVKKIDGLYYFLMQAKTEPGNIDGYLISPTVQATKSNYTKVHGGRFPPFVEFFLNRRKDGRRSIYEGLQSEEGARFWKKNNLNVILEVDEGEFDEIPPEFCWMTLYQLKQLLLRDNFVNVCARSVLSCLP